MDQEVKHLLEENLELEKENNQLLRTVVKKMYWQTVLTVMKWVFVLAITFGAFYFIEPFLNQLYSIYGGVGQSATQATQKASEFRDLLKNL